MKIILLKDVKGVGKRFDEKDVANGYALNFLIPKKLAVSLAGTSANAIKVLKDQIEQGKAKEEASLNESIQKISDTTLAVTLKANEQGHLFSAITRDKLCKMLEEKGIHIDSNLINLSGPIKSLGNFLIPIILKGGKETHFNLEITAL